MRSKLIPVIRTLLLSFLISIIILCLMALLMWKLSLSDGQVKTGLYLSYLLSCSAVFALDTSFLKGAFSGDFALESGISFYSHSSVLLSQRLLCRTPPFLFLAFAASEDALDHSLVSLSRSIFHSDTTYV